MKTDIEDFFDLDDTLLSNGLELDAQWFAWGVLDGTGLARRAPPEHDADEAQSVRAIRDVSYTQGCAAGAALRREMVPA